MKFTDYLYKKLIVITFLAIGTLSIITKVRLIKNAEQFDNEISNPRYELAVAMAYTSPEKIVKKEQRKLLKKRQKQAVKGFKSLSSKKLYRKAGLYFLSIDLKKAPEIAKEYHLSNQPGKATFALFKDGKLTKKSYPFSLEGDNIRYDIYDHADRLIDRNFGTIIEKILEEKEDRAWELRKIREESAAHSYWYNPWYDNYRYGSWHHPYYRNRYYNGVIFHLGID